MKKKRGRSGRARESCRLCTSQLQQRRERTGSRSKRKTMKNDPLENIFFRDGHSEVCLYRGRKTTRVCARIRHQLGSSKPFLCSLQAHAYGSGPKSRGRTTLAERLLDFYSIRYIHVDYSSFHRLHQFWYFLRRCRRRLRRRRR